MLFSESSVSSAYLMAPSRRAWIPFEPLEAKKKDEAAKLSVSSSRYFLLRGAKR